MQSFSCILKYKQMFIIKKNTGMIDRNRFNTQNYIYEQIRIHIRIE